MITSVISMGIQFVQSLWVTAYIQREMGIESYGYIAVIVNFVNMAGIVTVALTSVCSRYIVIELEDNDTTRINHIFNTVYFSILFIAAGCLLLFLIMAVHITSFIHISDEFVGQVSALMIIVGADFIIQLLQVPFLSVLYYEEKIYYNYYAAIITNIAKIAFVVALFYIWKPVLWGAYFASAFVNSFVLWIYNRYLKMHYPMIRKNAHFFMLEKLKDILGMGVWVSLSKLAAVLLSSCGTYLVNLLIGAYMAGIYGSVTQIQSILSFVTIAVVNVFLPQMYKMYAADDRKRLLCYTADGLKLLSAVLGIVVGGLIAFGDVFMSLWISDEYLNYKTLLIVSVYYLAAAYSSELLNQLLITIGRTKIPAVISIFAGIANIVLAVVLVTMCHTDIYGIAIAQMTVLCIRSVVFVPAYAAYCLKCRWNIFLSGNLFCVKSILITVAAGYFIDQIFVINTWKNLIFACFITGVSAVGILLLMDQDIRRFIFDDFLKKYKG